MIAVESFRKFRIIDLIIIFAFAGLWLLLGFLINKFISPAYSYILSLLLLVILMSLLVYLLRKAGTATLFYITAGLITYNINDLGPTGINKMIVLMIAGIIFEFVFLILKLEVKNMHLDIMIGAAVSSASIPFITAFLLAPDIALAMFRSIANLMLLSLFIGIAGSIISLLIWNHLRTRKIILKFEYER